MKFRLVIADEIDEDLIYLRNKERNTAITAINERVAQEPDRITKHRKQRRSSSIATWQLRITNVRIFYDIELDTLGLPVVIVRRVGEKVGNRLRIGGEWYEDEKY